MKPAHCAAQTDHRDNDQPVDFDRRSAGAVPHKHTGATRHQRVGDLWGSGTISDPERDNRGSLLELSWGGKEPLTLDSGETCSFIADADTLTLRGHAQGDGDRIDFGNCIGKRLRENS